MISASISGKGRHLRRSPVSIFSIFPAWTEGLLTSRIYWRSTCLGILREGRVELVVWGHFIGCLAYHFRLVSDKGLRGLSVVTCELSLIDFHMLGRLNICVRVGDTWDWVALGLDRQSDATVGASIAAEDAPAVDEGAQADPASMQAP
nr:hypothetical protein [Tanacetum cinerariifolium]